MKREYDGPAFDGRWQYISEREYTPVEYATPPEDGEIKTTFGELTDLQQQIVRHAMLNPDATVREIAEAVECDFAYVSEVLRKQRGESPNSRYRKDRWGDFTETQQEILGLAAKHPTWTQQEIADEVGVSDVTVCKVVNANTDLIDRLQRGVGSGPND